MNTYEEIITVCCDGKEVGTIKEVHDGWQYMRTWWRPYQPRYMVTLAKRFADDVVGAST